MAMQRYRKWLLLDKLDYIFKTIKTNNGIFGTIWSAVYLYDWKFGDVVGKDKYGNTYYENKYYFYGKDRWVTFNPKANCETDASMIPAEWHNWMMHITDKPPTVEPRVSYKWLADHTQNFSGSDMAYTPYSTTRTKIGSWTPPGGQIKIGPNK